MWRTTLFGSAKRGAGRGPATGQRPFRPRLELLEGRDVPSTLTVTNNLDRGAGSLRDAIGHAKDGDTICFDPDLNGQTITLTSGELAISKNLDIEGPGASLLAVGGNNASRIFDVCENQNSVTVTIAGLTIENGRSPGNGSGGAIYNVSSVLNLTNDVLSNNVARGSTAPANGGAVSNQHGGTLTVSNCTFSGNQAIGAAGAIFAGGGGIDNEAILSVSQSTFNDNRAQGGDGGTISHSHPFIGLGFGGGIENLGTATIDQCTFTGNRAVGGSGASGGNGASQYDQDAALGGGVWNYGPGTMTVRGCTFSYNQAIGGSNATVGTGGMGHVGDAGGGGLETEGGGMVTISDSTFDYNQAVGGSNIRGNGHNFIAGWGHGGAISNSSWTPTAGNAVPGQFPSTVIATNLTITDNEAVGGAGCTGPLAGLGDGGGIENWYGGTFTLSNSTLRNNRAVGGAGAAGQVGADGVGGGIANVMGATVTVNNCTMTGNQAVGGAGGSGGSGGNGFGGGLYNQGTSPFGGGSLTVTGGTVTGNSAVGGAAGSAGMAGQGVGGGAYFGDGGAVSLDAFTVAHLFGNHASTSNDDIFGDFTTGP